MKRFSILFLVLIMVQTALCSCAKVSIPNSAEAEKKLKELGYTVALDVQYGQMLEVYKIKQVTILTADKGEEFIQVYFFTNKEDTKTFYNDRATSLTRGVEVAKKNKYSIYRGTEQAVEDFLS